MSSEWGIDASILRMGTALYYIWSRFSPNSLQSLYIAKMNGPTSIGTPYLLSEPTNSWEKVKNPVNEGPVALYGGGKVFVCSRVHLVSTSNAGNWCSRP